MPKAKPNPKPREDDTMHGFPKDGDPFDPNKEEDEIEDLEPEIVEPPAPDPIETIRAENAELRQRLDRIQQDIAVGKQPPKEPEPDFYDGIEEKLFQNPADTLKGMEDRIVDRVSKEMTSSYRKDQGERDFWRDFYKSNPDLRDDDDLVKATLNGNMSALGGMPVAEAVSRLADLTRDRIARYAKTPRKRPHTEGARPPSPTPPPKEEDNVVTLSDIIRSRGAKRRGTAA